MIFEKILLLANKHHFFTPVLSKNKKNVLNYMLGPSGSLFQENIKTEWVYSSVTNRDTTVFMYNLKGKSSMTENRNYNDIKELCDDRFPFGIAEIVSENHVKEKEGDLCAADYFSCLCPTFLSTTMYMDPSSSMQYFFHCQRQRKLWWKKISAFPGRFRLSEMTTSANRTTVDILADFPWGKQVMETISVTMEQTENQTDSQMSEFDTFIPATVKCSLSLDCAVVGLFCDAIDEDSIHNTPVLRLHRKLTPHKCIFAARATDASLQDELNQLAFYLLKQIRKAGLAAVLLPYCTQQPLDTQFQRNDEWGVPYTVVLVDECLKSGIVGLRSRDTTLQEQVHISDLTNYMVQVFKNF